MDFQLPPRISAAQLPTPIEKPERLNRQFPGHTIYIKRDDLTGCALSGNKIRKLEFLAADALKRKADTLITCGGIQSNHARATAVLAAKLGLKAHLVLRGKPEESSGGNLFLNRIVGADFSYVTPEEYRDEILEIMQGIADDLKQRGKKAYIIPEGASNALGSMGYLHAVREMMTQWQHKQLKIDLIVTAVGSGGTYAGLLLGKFLHQLDCEIIGFNVCDDEDYFVNKIFGIIEDVKSEQGLDLGIKKADILIQDGYVGEGYAQSRPAEIALIQKIAQENGLFLDPVYTGKAMFGLFDQLQQGAFQKYENILFLHTGGIYGLFPKEDLF